MVLLGLAYVCPVLAEDTVKPGQTVAFIGDQFEITIEVESAQGAILEVDPTDPSWAGVEVVRIVSQTSTPSAAGTLHRLTLLVAPFALGDLIVAPSVIVTSGIDVQQRALPAFALRVDATLPASAPLELSPLPPPAAIGGGESPILRPALWTALIAGCLLFSTLLLIGVHFLSARLRRPAEVGPQFVPPPDLGTAEALIASDPVRAYRTMGTVVRGELARRYGFPAVALTTNELRRRMETEGVERWEARLVSGLLQECDAVIYAGYRPAVERCQADLTTAREIVGGG
jgi:hypothetical protein